MTQLSLLLFGLFMVFKPIDNSDVFLKSKFVVQGSTDTYEWELVCNVADLDVIVYLEDGKVNVEKLYGKIPVTELKNENKKMMDDAYQAFKGYDHPNIMFRLLEIMEVNKENGDILGKVEMVIAGVSKTFDIVVKTEDLGGEIVKISGWKSMKMTDFNIQPPQFFSGAIKAHNDIVVKFEMNVPISEKEEN